MDFCAACNKEVSATIELGGAEAAFKPIRSCSECGGRLHDAPPSPAPESTAKVLQLPRAAHAPVLQPSAPRSADQIIDEARARRAELDLQIPKLEGELASARAQRKGLDRMIAAYERAAAKG